MPDLQCPTCKSIYPDGTLECYRCKRPGTPVLRTKRHSDLVPVTTPAAVPVLREERFGSTTLDKPLSETA